MRNTTASTPPIISAMMKSAKSCVRSISPDGSLKSSHIMLGLDDRGSGLARLRQRIPSPEAGLPSRVGWVYQYFGKGEERLSSAKDIRLMCIRADVLQGSCFRHSLSGIIARVGLDCVSFGGLVFDSAPTWKQCALPGFRKLF